MSATLQIVCPHCSAVNRVPEERIEGHARCGKCKQALFTGKPVELNPANFHTHITRSDIPTVVDFWAPWCGPCRAMAPAFAQAAHQLEPRFRLAKLDTEAHPQLAAPYGIRSIPTMIIFRGGKELARQSGAMDTGSILRWVRG